MTDAAFYRLVAGGPDPAVESWRWQRAGHLARVLLNRLMYLVQRGRR